jgi:Putative auto-transporter adhesin, head GIN domain
MTIAPAPLHQRRAPHPLVLGFSAMLLGALITVGIVLLVRDNGSGSTAALRGSGKEAVQSRAVARFHAIDLTGANNVVVYVGGPRSVAVRVDDNLIKYVTTRVQAGTLAIGQTRSFTTNSPSSVEISVPSLDAATLSGTGTFDVTGVQARHFVARMPGSGKLTVTGTAKTLDAELAGAGDVRLEGLVANDVTATVAGAGRLLVDATHNLNATVSGAGVIEYRGSPAKVTQHVTGIGSIAQG